MIHRETLNSTISTLMHKNFAILLEDGREVQFHFRRDSFHHLLGLQYLDDFPHISKPKDKNGIVKALIRDNNLVHQIERSINYPSIEKRINNFYRVVDMLISDKCEIIIDFDKTLVPSTRVESEFFLYKTEDYQTYYMLGIAKDKRGIYYPETYIVENSKYYITGQNLFICTILHKDFPYKTSILTNSK